MKASLFLAVVLIAGFSAGLIHGLINLVVVEPYLDRAISIENQNRFASGEIQNTSQFWEEFGKYRVWQKESSIISGGILGLSTGALFGIVFAYSRNKLPSQHNITKALVLAGIMWFTLFFIPFLKYPSNPPTVGDPETIAFRSLIYIAFIALSGLGALGFAKLYNRLQNRKFLIPIGYAVYMILVFLLMPQNPDKITAPLDLINGFRIASLSTMTLYWIINAIILGLLWQKFQPDVVTTKT
ncbi:CbtA family protein [Candidatus Pacearchaeota archaeon]|nr:CbtA family protein [Candidatus Pacearchaeota archaeon]